MVGSYGAVRGTLERRHRYRGRMLAVCGSGGARRVRPDDAVWDPRPRLIGSPVATTPLTPDHARADDPVVALTFLVEEAAWTDPGAATWMVLARRARTVTAALADAGILPRHLVVAPSDPPVVIARALLMAARAAGRAPVRAAADEVPGATACA